MIRRVTGPTGAVIDLEVGVEGTTVEVEVSTAERVTCPESAVFWTSVFGSQASRCGFFLEMAGGMCKEAADGDRGRFREMAGGILESEEADGSRSLEGVDEVESCDSEGVPDEETSLANTPATPTWEGTRFAVLLFSGTSSVRNVENVMEGMNSNTHWMMRSLQSRMKPKDLSPRMLDQRDLL